MCRVDRKNTNINSAIYFLHYYTHFALIARATVHGYFEYSNLQCRLRNFALCHSCVEMQRNSYARKVFYCFCLRTTDRRINLLKFAAKIAFSASALALRVEPK
jgi:hypothetical protein